jgi:hypothetical protein
MYAEISAAIASARSLGDLLKAASSLHNFNEFVAAVSDVNSKLMEATAVALKSQERHAELLNQVAELERQIEELKRQQDLGRNYTLHKFETGALAYRYSGSDEGTPEHFVCSKCLDAGSHTKLQPFGNFALICNACESKIPHRFTPPLPPAAPQRQIAPRNW